MNTARVISALLRRGRSWAARHGVRAAVRRARELIVDPRTPSWRAYAAAIAREPAADAGGALAAVRGSDAAARSPEGQPSALDVAVCVPVRDADPALLDALVESVTAQSHPRWELCLAGTGAALEALRTRTADEPRVRIAALPSPAGISEATNAAAALTDAEVLVFADQDDRLGRGLLAALAHAFADDDELDVAYADEDQLTAWGLRTDPAFKPGPSPALLLGFNYVTHPLALRHELWRALDGLRTAFDGAQDHDLALRAFERARRVRHLPRVGYHWRRTPGSVASSSVSKPWAFEAGRRAVEDAARRRGLAVVGAVHGARPGVYTLEFARPVRPTAAHVVLHGDPVLRARWRASLGTLAHLVRVVGVHDGDWPGVADADVPWLVLDARLRPDEHRLARLLAWTAHPGVGAVATAGVHDGRRAHLGWTLTREGVAEPVLAGLRATRAGPGLLATSAREVAASAGGALWIARPDPELARTRAGAGVDARGQLLHTLAVAARGGRTVFVPDAAPQARGRVDGPAVVALAGAPGWAEVVARLPRGFWRDGSDALCPRHELLVPLGLPAPVNPR